MDRPIKTKKTRFYKTKTKTSTLSRVVPYEKKVDVSLLKYEISEKGWYVFVNSYLGLAKIGCQKLEERLSGDKKVIAISIIYNLKHALEVIIKAFQKTLNKQEDIEKTHDIEKLFKELDSRLKKRIKTKRGKQEISKATKKLEQLVKKYTELNFLNKYLKDCFNIEDIKNELFQYPEYSSYIRIDYSRLVNQITKEDIKNIKQDINKLSSIIKKIRKIFK